MTAELARLLYMVEQISVIEMKISLFVLLCLPPPSHLLNQILSSQTRLYIKTIKMTTHPLMIVVGTYNLVFPTFLPLKSSSSFYTISSTLLLLLATSPLPIFPPVPQRSESPLLSLSSSYISNPSLYKNCQNDHISLDGVVTLNVVRIPPTTVPKLEQWLAEGEGRGEGTLTGSRRWKGAGARYQRSIHPLESGEFWR